MAIIAAGALAGAACGAAPRAALPTSTSAGYRLLGVAALEGPGSDGNVFQVRIRLNRRIPKGRSGYEATMLLGGASPDADLAPFGNRSRYCYSAVIGDDFDATGLRGKKVGDTAELSMRIGKARFKRAVTLTWGRSATDAIKSLGCGHRTA